MSRLDPKHINTSVKIKEGPGQPVHKPGGPGTLKSLLARVQGLPVPDDDPTRRLLATPKSNGYRAYAEFLPGEAGDLKVFTSGCVLNSELTAWLKATARTHDFNPMLFRKHARLMCEASAHFNGGEVGHMGMATALKWLRACQRHGIPPEQVGLTFCLKVFAISSLGPIGPYQFYSKEFELEQARVLTGMTRRAGGTVEWPAMRPVEGMAFRVAADGRIFDEESDEPVSTIQTFAGYLMDRRAGDGEGFVVYAHNSQDVAGGPLFTRPDAHGKPRSRTFSKVLRQFRGVFAARPGVDRNGDLVLELFTVTQPGSKELTRVGAMPRPQNCPGISSDQLALYSLSATWVYPTGSVAGVNVPWDNPDPDVVAAERAHERVTPISQLIANNPHLEAVWARNRTLDADVGQRLNRLLAEKEDAKNAPVIRTTAQLIKEGGDLQEALRLKFVPADSDTMLRVQAARARAGDPLRHLSLDGLTNNPKDGRLYVETLVLTTRSRWTREQYKTYCSRLGDRPVQVVSTDWLSACIEQGRLLVPIDERYNVVRAPSPETVRRPPKPAKRAREEPDVPAPPRPTGLVRCHTNGLPPVSQQHSPPEDA